MTTEPQSPPSPREALTQLLACPDLNLDSLEPVTVAAIEEAKASLELPDSQDYGVCKGIRLTRDKNVSKVTLDYGQAQVEVLSTRQKNDYAPGWKINWLVKQALATGSEAA